MEIQQQEEFLSCRDRAPVTQAAEGGEALPEKAVPWWPRAAGRQGEVQGRSLALRRGDVGQMEIPVP